MRFRFRAMRPKLGFRKSEHSRTIDSSPVSVINVLRSNTSVVVSSSFRFSQRRQSLFLSFRSLSGHSSGGESLSGLDPDPDKDLVHKPSGFTDTTHRADKVVQKQDSHSDAEEDLSTDSTPVSSSLALKDCQDGRSNSKGNVHRKKWSPRHQVYIKVETSSPRLETLKNNSYPSRPSSAVYSPGTPTYQRSSVSMQKGWNSERMPLTHKGNRVGPALLPLNNVKALPSKWEDAERWIFSPVSGDSSHNHQQPVHQHQLHRKPKAKSGPLGPPGSAMYTPVRPIMSERKRASGDIMAGLPFSDRLMETNGLSTLCDGIRKGSTARLEHWMPRSISLHGCSVELPDEKVDNMNDSVSRRGIGTHISPGSSANNSSFIRMSCECNEEQEQSTYLEIIDVEVDRKVTIGSLKKNVHRANQSSRSSRRVDDCMKKTIAPDLGRSTTYEIRITAWENLQKAKAEAAIQKLEMKLEKKKASSMEKIMKKLKSSQKKAQEMRKSMLAGQLDHAAKPASSDISSSIYKLRQKSSLISGYFTCHAFDLT